MKSPPPLELNWQFQAPKVQGFFRHNILSFIIFFWIFINVNLPTFKKKKFGARENIFSALKMHLLSNISQWTPCMIKQAVNHLKYIRRFVINIENRLGLISLQKDNHCKLSRHWQNYSFYSFILVPLLQNKNLYYSWK